MALSKSKVSGLVAQLNSRVEGEAKRAAAELDAVLYPNYGPGPRVVSVDESQRITAAHYAAIRGSNVIEPLLETIRDGTEFAQTYAATVLGAIGDDRALPRLIEALSASSPLVRSAATRGLSFFRNPSTVPAMVQVLQDSNSEVRNSAAYALGIIGSPEAVPPLMEFFERGDAESKATALFALGYIGDPRSLPLARVALMDKTRKVRDAAKSALARYDLKRRQSLDH